MSFVLVIEISIADNQGMMTDSESGLQEIMDTLYSSYHYGLSYSYNFREIRNEINITDQGINVLWKAEYELKSQSLDTSLNKSRTSNILKAQRRWMANIDRNLNLDSLIQRVVQQQERAVNKQILWYYYEEDNENVSIECITKQM